jgi:uncharacterized protein (DUF885 family)
MKRALHLAVLLCLVPGACSGPPAVETPAAGTSAQSTPADSTSAHDELQRLGDEYIDAVAALDPIAIVSGLSDVRTPDYSALTDNTPDGLASFQRKEDSILERLRKIDPAPLARADWVTWQSLKETLEASVGQRVCRSELWDLNHLASWHTSLATQAREQPVGTDAERAAALERWSSLPTFIAQSRANLEEGLREGYSVPKSIVRRVIGQFDRIVAAPLEENPFYEFAKKADEQPDFQAPAKTLLEKEIVPALVAYRDFLRDTYLPAARDEIAIKALPDGVECYEARLRAWHSAQIGAQRTYERGQDAVAANEAAVIERGKAMFGESDIAAILARVSEAPGNRFASEAELIDATRALVPVAREKVARFFTRLPEQALVVEPFPEFLRGTGQASRYEDKPQSEGPAVYRIATDAWATQTRGRTAIIAAHEGWPGHHLQIATARGLQGLHPVTRLATSAAYIEGWARYAEALAEEAGIYEGGYAEITRRAWPARGMVIDPGIHLYGWTREQAVAFAMASGNYTPQTADDLVDRVAAWPGQLTAYDTGGLEIFALRKEAEERLGDAFDIRAFHDRILENGALPLAALREHVEAWIAAGARPGEAR